MSVRSDDGNEAANGPAGPSDLDKEIDATLAAWAMDFKRLQSLPTIAIGFGSGGGDPINVVYPRTKTEMQALAMLASILHGALCDRAEVKP